MAFVQALIALLVSSHTLWPISFRHLAHHCQHTLPITRDEFHHRHTALLDVLRNFNASTYIAEPGPNTAYYANFSLSDWKLSERPLLLIISTQGSDPQAVAVLTPKFEATRARKLAIPFHARYIEWSEDANPYSVLASSLSASTGTIFVDSHIRKFLSDGLQAALPNATIASAPDQVTELRERKSAAEINILRCANEVTLLAIREVHRRMRIGMRETEARSMMASALAAAGLQEGGCLTLFGENGALPHGSGTDRVLGESDFALFDCTASLHGYYSDVTRTLALPESNISARHQQIWNHVYSAQREALRAVRAKVSAHTVDAAARSYLDVAGYASYFTHRLGHGIGLEVHEEPYLKGGSDAVIRSGHTCSNEPGIYIEGQVGVRLEDCFFVDEQGHPVLLTERV